MVAKARAAPQAMLVAVIWQLAFGAQPAAAEPWPIKRFEVMAVRPMAGLQRSDIATGNRAQVQCAARPGSPRPSLPTRQDRHRHRALRLCRSRTQSHDKAGHGELSCRFRPGTYPVVEYGKPKPELYPCQVLAGFRQGRNGVAPGETPMGYRGESGSLELTSFSPDFVSGMLSFNARRGKTVYGERTSAPAAMSATFELGFSPRHHPPRGEFAPMEYCLAL